MAFITIYITHENEQAAKRIAEHLVSAKLVACANLYPIQSIYWWKDAIQNESEWVSLVKTTENKWEAVKSYVEKMHPYDVPCIMKTKVEANETYEDWIRSSIE